LSSWGVGVGEAHSPSTPTQPRQRQKHPSPPTPRNGSREPIRYNGFSAEFFLLLLWLISIQCPPTPPTPPTPQTKHHPFCLGPRLFPCGLDTHPAAATAQHKPPASSHLAQPNNCVGTICVFRKPSPVVRSLVASFILGPISPHHTPPPRFRAVFCFVIDGGMLLSGYFLYWFSIGFALSFHVFNLVLRCRMEFARFCCFVFVLYFVAVVVRRIGGGARDPMPRLRRGGGVGAGVAFVATLRGAACSELGGSSPTAPAAGRRICLRSKFITTTLLVVSCWIV